MKRRTPLIGTLALALVAGVASIGGTPASALPSAPAGGPAELLRYVGDPSSATGNALANGECDVNRDDKDDLVVGAWFWDKAPNNNIGAAYVLLGGDAVKGASLADPEEAGAVRIDGPAKANATVAFAVACIGDVNGDGNDDIAISDYIEQRAFIVFGAEDFTGLTLDSLGDRGFTVKGGPDSGNVGFSMAPVGDLNNDGLDDFAVAEVAADTQGRTNNGRVWVVAGRDEISDVDLLAPTTGQLLMTVDGAYDQERIGSIADVGDVNGDGVDDFLLGAYVSTPWGTSVAATGAAYVIFGGAGATGEIDTRNLGTKGFTINGPTRQRDRLGIAVSAAGDINGDGKADLLIGADGVNNAATGPRNGGAAVVFGSASTDRVYTDPLAANGQSVFTCAAPAPVAATDPCVDPARRGYWIDGAANSDATGYAVAGIGDVNGDSVPDLAIGAYGYDPVNPAGGTFSGGGAVYVVYGKPAAVTQSLLTLPAEDGYRIDGTLNGDRFGRQVGLIGDFDGNGVRDLGIGADFAARGASQNGEITVALFGKLNTTVELDAPTGALPTDDVTFTATVAKPAGDQTALGAGTVAFSVGGSTIAACSAAPVVSGTASCTTSFADELTGDVVATYSGTDDLKGAASEASAFTVAKAASTTSLLVSEEAPFTGQVVQLLAKVTGAGDEAVTTGKVAFASAGTAIPGCGAVAVNDEGYASCSTSWSARGTYAVTAAYAGSAQVAASTSPATPVVAGADAIVRAQAASGTYGTTAAVLAGEVQGSGRVATGTVTLKSGSTVLGTANLVGGRYSLTLGTTAVLPGTRTITAEYGGDARHNPATDRTTLTITKAKPTVALTVTPSAPKIGTKAVTTVTVTAPGAVPTGTVKIQMNGRTLATITLVNGKGTATMPAFGGRGTKAFTAVYSGSSKIGTGTSATKTLVVR